MKKRYLTQSGRNATYVIRNMTETGRNTNKTYPNQIKTEYKNVTP